MCHQRVNRVDVRESVHRRSSGSGQKQKKQKRREAGKAEKQKKQKRRETGKAEKQKKQKRREAMKAENQEPPPQKNKAWARKNKNKQPSISLHKRIR